MDDARTTAARAVLTGLIMAVLAMLGVAAIRVFLFVLDSPGWWVLVLAIGLGSAGAQWLLDRRKPAE